MTLENRKTYEAISEYNNEEKIKASMIAHRFSLTGILSMSVFLLIIFLRPENFENSLLDLIEGMTVGIAFGSLISVYIFTGFRVNRLMEAKKRILSKSEKKF